MYISIEIILVILGISSLLLVILACYCYFLCLVSIPRGIFGSRTLNPDSAQEHVDTMDGGTEINCEDTLL